jgi:hypothetical protein
MFEVVKKNKRLYVRNAVEEYTPPDFLRDKIITRQQLQKVADRLNTGHNYADVIMEFESSIMNDYRSKGDKNAR